MEWKKEATNFRRKSTKKDGRQEKRKESKYEGRKEVRNERLGKEGKRNNI